MGGLTGTTDCREETGGLYIRNNFWVQEGIFDVAGSYTIFNT